jgi:hypothetical protein
MEQPTDLVMRCVAFKTGLSQDKLKRFVETHDHMQSGLRNNCDKFLKHAHSTGKWGIINDDVITENCDICNKDYIVFRSRYTKKRHEKTKCHQRAVEEKILYEAFKKEKRLKNISTK